MVSIKFKILKGEKITNKVAFQRRCTQNVIIDRWILLMMQEKQPLKMRKLHKSIVEEIEKRSSKRKISA